jgi:orotidine-5'-phosphate decarboxylase
VSLQYSSGVYKIASWSHFTNAHLVPGPGIISGLAKVGKPKGRGLMLLAEMSSAGNLATGDYSKACVEEAERDDSGYVMGFIAMNRVDERFTEAGKKKNDYLIMTPGVGLDVKGDSLGQQYRTPDEVINKSGCDVMIVGRGIYGPMLQEAVLQGDAAAREKAVKEVQEQGERYKQAGWEAYQKRIGATKST